MVEPGFCDPTVKYTMRLYANSLLRPNNRQIDSLPTWARDTTLVHDGGSRITVTLAQRFIPIHELNLRVDDASEVLARNASAVLFQKSALCNPYFSSPGINLVGDGEMTILVRPGNGDLLFLVDGNGNAAIYILSYDGNTNGKLPVSVNLLVRCNVLARSGVAHACKVASGKFQMSNPDVSLFFVDRSWFFLSHYVASAAGRIAFLMCEKGLSNNGGNHGKDIDSNGLINRDPIEILKVAWNFGFTSQQLLVEGAKM